MGLQSILTVVVQSGLRRCSPNRHFCLTRLKIADLHDEMKRKEQRWSSSTTRLRDRIEAVEQENNDLKAEVKLLERRRLEEWQQRDVRTNTRAATAAVRDVEVLQDATRDVGGAPARPCAAPEAAPQQFNRVSST